MILFDSEGLPEQQGGRGCQNLKGTSIEQYRESLLHMKAYAGAYDVMWGGHGDESLPEGVVDEAIELCEKILRGEDDAVPEEFHGRPALYGARKDEAFRRLDGKVANIAYIKDKLWKEQVQRPAFLWT